MRNKVRKSVRCNYIIKRLTMERLAKFTNCKLGEIYDRLIEGKGIVSIKDQCALKKAYRLRGLLTKIDFPKHKNAMLHNHMAIVKENYQKQLEILISQLEIGCKPVYYWEMAQQKYKNDFRKMGVILDHDAVNLVYRRKIKDELLKDFKHYQFFYAYFVYSKQMKKIDGCYKGRKSSKRRVNYKKDKNYLKNFDKYHDDIYRSSHLNSLSDDDIIDGIKKCVYDLFNTYSDFFDLGMMPVGGVNDMEDDNDDDYVYVSWVEDMDFKIEEAVKLPYDDFYNTMTSHPRTFNGNKFRNAVEYIAHIPSKIDTLQYDVLEILDNDINLIKNELVSKKVEWFHECRKNDPLSFSKKLVNLFDRLMMNFKIPFIEEESTKNYEDDKVRNIFNYDIIRLVRERCEYLHLDIGRLYLPVNYKRSLDVIGIDCYDIHYYMPVNYNISIEKNLDNLEEMILYRYLELFGSRFITHFDDEENPDNCKSYSLVVENRSYAIFNTIPIKLRTIEFQFTETEMSGLLYNYLEYHCSTEDLKLIDNNLYLKLMSKALKIVKPLYAFLGLYGNPDDLYNEECRGVINDLEIVLPENLIKDVYDLD